MIFKRKEPQNPHKPPQLQKPIQILNLKLKPVGKCRNITLPPNITNHHNIGYGSTIHCEVYAHDKDKKVIPLGERNFIIKKVGRSKMITLPPKIVKKHNLRIGRYIHLIILSKPGNGP